MVRCTEPVGEKDGAATAEAAVEEVTNEIVGDVGPGVDKEDDRDDEYLLLAEVDEAAADEVEIAVMTFTVEQGKEFRMVVALLEQQSSLWPVTPCTPAQRQELVSPSPAPPQSWMRVFSLLPPSSCYFRLWRPYLQRGP